MNLNTRSEMPVLEARSLVPPQPPPWNGGGGGAFPRLGGLPLHAEGLRLERVLLGYSAQELGPNHLSFMATGPRVLLVQDPRGQGLGLPAPARMLRYLSLIAFL